MACPTVVIIGKKIILLSGFQRRPPYRLRKGQVRVGRDPIVVIQEMSKLRQSASENPDAVAFGFTAGRWLPAA